MEADSAGMRVQNNSPIAPKRFAAAMVIILAAGVLFALAFRGGGPVALAAQNPATGEGYVGSEVCAKCHPSIYESYSKTDMGRSMSSITPALLRQLPVSASVFDSRLNRHFEVFTRDGSLYQSEYETGADGKEVFRATHQIEWIIGSGANGMGAIVPRRDYLFEAPLSFYSKTGQWALSPGYEFGDYGFDRPILPGCVACHSGRPRLAADGNGHFEEPPFDQLAIGCENCHGPGASHVAEMQMASAVEGTGGSITNPAKLSPWLADNICMSCHQAGDARVLRPGKQYSDFRPGAELDDTLEIFLVPFVQASAPKDDLLEHYLSMRLSKCYRGSAGKLSCIRCHDPHAQPSAQEAPAYFRVKCLTCHTEKSCALPLSLRQHQSPPDDCAGCHMPKRDVKVISHSVLTNHRIVAQAEEPFPDAAFHMTTPQLPDLVHLSADPTRPDEPSPLMLLQAYGQVMLSHPEYRGRYWAVARQLEGAQPDNIVVQQAMADWILQQKTSDAASLAIGYLQAAVRQGSTNPPDFEQLAALLVAANRQSDALEVLRKGMALITYDAQFYRLTAKLYFSANQKLAACELVRKGMENFPQDTVLRDFTKRCASEPQH